MWPKIVLAFAKCNLQARDKSEVLCQAKAKQLKSKSITKLFFHSKTLFCDIPLSKRCFKSGFRLKSWRRTTGPFEWESEINAYSGQILAPFGSGFLFRMTADSDR